MANYSQNIPKMEICLIHYSVFDPKLKPLKYSH